ncbi:hypothetical protein G7054_g5624 [Neopestalotiopsis clavispora]|nr:hypothetical protein G7054_g5624 [Neopestalotiopsis clavispora]
MRRGNHPSRDRYQSRRASRMKQQSSRRCETSTSASSSRGLGSSQPTTTQQDTQLGHAQLPIRPRGSQFDEHSEGPESRTQSDTARRGPFTARRGNAHGGIRQTTLLKATTATNPPASEVEGVEGRPIVLEGTPPPINKARSRLNNPRLRNQSHGMVSISDRSTIAQESSHTRPTMPTHPKEREESPEEEYSPLVSRAPGKRTASGKSPTYVEPTDAWWLPPQRKIRLLEICIGFERDDWRFARNYVMNLCKDRHNDMMRDQKQQLRPGTDDLGRVMHRWISIMIRRNAHQNVHLAGNGFWLQFEGMVKQALNQVVGSETMTNAVISKIKRWVATEKDVTERGRESAASTKAEVPNVTTSSVVGDKRKRSPET